MMVFLFILKIIGIILLVILGLVFLGIILVLFCPFRYSIKGNVHEKNAVVHVSLSWLFRLVCIHFNYDKEMKGYLRILGIKKNLFDSFNREASVTSVQENWDGIHSDDHIEENTEVHSDEKESAKSKREKTAQTKHQKDDRNDDVCNQTKTSKISNIKKKLKQIKQKYNKIKKMMGDSHNKAALTHLKEEVFRLLKCIMPKKLCLDVSYSTGAPDTTAQVFGILAMFPIGYQNRWKIYPDFEAEAAYIEGDADIKGRIYMISVLLIGIRILFDKNCRRLKRQFDKL